MKPNTLFTVCILTAIVLVIWNRAMAEPVTGKESLPVGNHSSDSSYLRMPVVLPAPSPTVTPISFQARVSFYSSSPEEGTGRTTAFGGPVSRGVFAVHRDQLEKLPEGTLLDIEGVGEGTISDTCPSCKENWIDVWVPSREEAFERGVVFTTATVRRANE